MFLVKVSLRPVQLHDIVTRVWWIWHQIHSFIHLLYRLVPEFQGHGSHLEPLPAVMGRRHHDALDESPVDGRDKQPFWHQMKLLKAATVLCEVQEGFTDCKSVSIKDIFSKLPLPDRGHLYTKKSMLLHYLMSHFFLKKY